MDAPALHVRKQKSRHVRSTSRPSFGCAVRMRIGSTSWHPSSVSGQNRTVAENAAFGQKTTSVRLLQAKHAARHLGLLSVRVTCLAIHSFNSRWPHASLRNIPSRSLHVAREAVERRPLAVVRNKKADRRERKSLGPRDFREQAGFDTTSHDAGGNEGQQILLREQAREHGG